MRIAQIAPPWLTVPPSGYGGIERLVGNLTEGLVSRGHDVTLFACPGSQTGGRLISPLPYVPLHEAPSATDDNALYMLNAYLYANQFDVIHDHTQSRIGQGLGAMLNSTPPVVHTIHMPWTSVRQHFLGQIDDRIHIVATSEAQAKTNPTVRYAATIYSGIDVDMHPSGDRKLDYLVFVGRCSYEKGPDIALDVATAAGLPLVLVLKRGEYGEAEWRFFEEEVQPKLRDCDKVVEQPPHHEKIRLLQQARATLFPLRWDEPFGQVMAESMACGTPVIATRRGAAEDLIVDGQTGFLCDTTQEMVARVEDVSTLSSGICRAHVVENFSSNQMVVSYERLYQSLVETRN